MPYDVIVIGATGHFGGRICRRLLDEPNIKLVVTSRLATSADSFVSELQQLHPDANVIAAQLDFTSAAFENDLKDLNPNIVVHTAGPFQGQDYRVAQACVNCESHYIDLADGRDFVQQFEQLNEAALQRGLTLISGASTLPGLSSAVIDTLKHRFSEIHSIEISIAPAHQTPRGTGTVAAVLSYCGKPFKVLVDGKWVTKFGWQDLRSQRYPALGFRLSGACDVPDLGLLPDYVPGVRTVTFHAALKAKWEQLTLWLMSYLTRLRVVKNWHCCVPFLRWLGNCLIDLGSDAGAMHIKLSGIDHQRRAISTSWYLSARENHGPEIPCAPALILVRKIVRGEFSKPGAFPCLGMFTLSEFDAEIGDLEIDWNVDD